MFYPKDYTYNLPKLKLNSAFLIMPFNDKFEIVHGVINEVCINMGIVPQRADDIFTPKPIIANILDGISRSEIIIVDLTQKNPNVFYELGIAHSLRDENAIILLTQNINNIPFDIRHWPVIKYSNENIPALKVALKNKIQVCLAETRQDEFIKQYLLAHNFEIKEILTFINAAKKFEDFYSLILALLKNDTRDIQKYKNEISKLLERFVILEELQSGLCRKAALNVKLSVFISDYIINHRQDVLKQLLCKSEFNLIHLDQVDKFCFIAELCFTLIEKQVLKEECINWLIDYLHNYRMGRIDIIRTKIETFLVNNNDDDVNNSIIQMLKSETITVRESAADICGQKKLYQATELLTTTLKRETNPHVARSCITALARLQAYNAVPVIFEWMGNNRDKWGKQAVSASLKSIALAALKELDNENSYYEKLIRL